MCFFFAFPHVTQLFSIHRIFLFASLFYFLFSFFFPFFFLSRFSVTFETVRHFESFDGTASASFSMRRVRGTAPAKITHVKVGCINYSERHLSPMACRLDERKKKKEKNIHPSAQVVPTLWPWGMRKLSWPCAPFSSRDFHPPDFRPRAFRKHRCRAPLTRNSTGEEETILD